MSNAPTENHLIRAALIAKFGRLRVGVASKAGVYVAASVSQVSRALANSGFDASLAMVRASFDGGAVACAILA